MAESPMLATTHRLPMSPSRRIATAIASAFSSSWSRPKSPIMTMSSCEPTSAVSEPTARRASNHSEPNVSPACISVYEASCDSFRALLASAMAPAVASTSMSGVGSATPTSACSRIEPHLRLDLESLRDLLGESLILTLPSCILDDSGDAPLSKFAMVPNPFRPKMLPIDVSLSCSRPSPPLPPSLLPIAIEPRGITMPRTDAAREDNRDKVGSSLVSSSVLACSAMVGSSTVAVAVGAKVGPRCSAASRRERRPFISSTTGARMMLPMRWSSCCMRGAASSASSSPACCRCSTTSRCSSSSSSATYRDFQAVYRPWAEPGWSAVWSSPFIASSMLECCATTACIS
mmetsp:Transcript_5389/g.12492  ORF Transcript_5389/g.12492 Transcript_5389/m.12492 type:complete len:346 (+) Transcript_5389:1092-2129(+)